MRALWVSTDRKLGIRCADVILEFSADWLKRAFVYGGGLHLQADAGWLGAGLLLIDRSRRYRFEAETVLEESGAGRAFHRRDHRRIWCVSLLEKESNTCPK